MKDSYSFFKYPLTFSQLSTVEGGATIFPNLGISVLPTQGSLLFWYNTYSDGNRNDFTLHASCPVLEGVKISKIRI